MYIVHSLVNELTMIDAVKSDSRVVRNQTYWRQQLHCPSKIAKKEQDSMPIGRQNPERNSPKNPESAETEVWWITYSSFKSCAVGWALGRAHRWKADLQANRIGKQQQFSLPSASHLPLLLPQGCSYPMPLLPLLLAANGEATVPNSPHLLLH